MIGSWAINYNTKTYLFKFSRSDYWKLALILILIYLYGRMKAKASGLDGSHSLLWKISSLSPFHLPSFQYFMEQP